MKVNLFNQTLNQTAQQDQSIGNLLGRKITIIKEKLNLLFHVIFENIKWLFSYKSDQSFVANHVVVNLLNPTQIQSEPTTSKETETPDTLPAGVPVVETPTEEANPPLTERNIVVITPTMLLEVKTEEQPQIVVEAPALSVTDDAQSTQLPTPKVDVPVDDLPQTLVNDNVPTLDNPINIIPTLPEPNHQVEPIQIKLDEKPLEIASTDLIKVKLTLNPNNNEKVKTEKPTNSISWGTVAKTAIIGTVIIGGLIYFGTNLYSSPQITNPGSLVTDPILLGNGTTTGSINQAYLSALNVQSLASGLNENNTTPITNYFSYAICLDKNENSDINESSTQNINIPLSPDTTHPDTTYTDLLANSSFISVSILVATIFAAKWRSNLLQLRKNSGATDNAAYQNIDLMNDFSNEINDDSDTEDESIKVSDGITEALLENKVALTEEEKVLLDEAKKAALRAQAAAAALAKPAVEGAAIPPPKQHSGGRPHEVDLDSPNIKVTSLRSHSSYVNRYPLRNRKNTTTTK